MFELPNGFTIEALVETFNDVTTVERARQIVRSRIALLPRSTPTTYEHVIIRAADVMLGDPLTARLSTDALSRWVFQPLPRDHECSHNRLRVLATAFAALAVRDPFPEMTNNILVCMVASMQRLGCKAPSGNSLSTLCLSPELAKQVRQQGLQSVGC